MPQGKTRKEALDAGMDMFLAKPFLLKELRHTIVELIKQTRGAPQVLGVPLVPDVK
jgi:DNA-binding response OmpR family regulator